MMAVQLRGPYWLKRGAVHFGINEQSVHTVVCLQIGTNPNLQVVMYSKISGCSLVMQGNFVTYGINNMQVQKYVVIFGSMDWSHCSTIQSEPWPTSLNRAPVLTQFSERWVSPHKHLSFPFRAVLRSEVLPRDRDMRQGAERRAGEYKTIWDVNKRILYSYNFDKNERAR